MALTLKELGNTGLQQYSGFIQEDFLQEWRGKKAYKNANEMRLNSPVVAGLLFAIEQAVRSVDWQWTSEVGEEDPRLELVQESLDNMSHSWNDHIIEALTFLPFGFAPFEIVYERVDGKILWRKFAIRGQDTVYKWGIDEEGGITGFDQQTVVQSIPVFIPIERLILYRLRSERNNPEGRSILRPAWIPYYYAKNIMQIEAIGIERDLAGLPVITLPAGADPAGEDMTEAAEIVRRIRNDEQAGLVLSEGWGFQLAGSLSGRLFDTNSIIGRYEKRILMGALAQFLVLGMDQIGSLALSEDQTDFFNMSVNATADIIAETITRHTIPRLMRLNGLDPNGLKLEHSPAGDTNVEAVSFALQAITPQLTWTAEDEVWLRGLFKLPVKTTEEIEEAREVQRQQDIEKAASNPFLRNIQGLAAEKSSELYEREAPDNDVREKHERKWDKLFREFFEKQRSRVLNSMKEK